MFSYAISQYDLCFLAGHGERGAEQVHHVCLQTLQGGVPLLGHAEQNRTLHPRYRWVNPYVFPCAGPNDMFTIALIILFEQSASPESRRTIRT